MVALFILTLSIIHCILALTDCLPSAYDSYRQFSPNVLAWFHISPYVLELHFQTFELRVEQGQNHISQALLQHAYLMDLFYHHTMSKIKISPEQTKMFPVFFKSVHPVQ